MGDEAIFKNFRCSNDFLMQKVYFSLNNVSGVYLVQISLPLIGQQGLGDFFRYRPLLPIGWRIVQILRLRQRKTTNTAPITLSAKQEPSQSAFINEQLYSTCNSRNDKNKQLNKHYKANADWH